MKILSIVLVALFLISCSNDEGYRDSVAYQEPEYQEPIQVVEDDGFGATEFIAGAAVGSLVTKGVNDMNTRKNYTRNSARLDRPKALVDRANRANRAVKRVGSNPVNKLTKTSRLKTKSTQSRRIDRASIKRSSFKSSARSSPRSSSRR